MLLGLGLFQFICLALSWAVHLGEGRRTKTPNQTTTKVCFLTICCGVEGCKPFLVPPQEEELYACQRGCRLFSICQFVDDGADLNRTKQECDSGEPSEPLQHPLTVQGRAAVSERVVLNWWYSFSCFGFV